MENKHYQLSGEDAEVIMEAINGYLECMYLRMSKLEGVFDAMHDYFYDGAAVTHVLRKKLL